MLVVLAALLGSFVAVTWVLLRRARRLRRPSRVARPWLVAGWMVWATLLLSLRPPDALEDAVRSWSGSLPEGSDAALFVIPVLAGVAAAIILFLGALLDVYAERRALPWAAGYFLLTIASIVTDALVPGSDGLTRGALFVAVTSVPPLVGLVALGIAWRTPSLGESALRPRDVDAAAP